MPIYRIQAPMDEESIAMFGYDFCRAKAEEVVTFYLRRHTTDHSFTITWSERPYTHDGIEIPGITALIGEITLPD